MSHGVLLAAVACAAVTLSAAALPLAPAQAAVPPNTEAALKVLALLATPALDRQDLGDGLTLLSGSGGNVIVAHDAGGALIVDTKEGEGAEQLLSVLEELGAGPRRIAINTHWHTDHTDGNVVFAEAGVQIVAHENVRVRRAEAQEMTSMGRSFPALAEHALPRLTFRKQLTLHSPAGRVNLIHVPNAHTDGDSVVHFVDRDLIHAGDLFEGQNFPFIDIDANGSLSGMIRALDTILALAGPDTRIVPGHGAVATRSDIESVRDMYAETFTRLSAALDEGADAQELYNSDPLADYPEHWGAGDISRRGFTFFALNSVVAEREAAEPEDG